VDAALAGLLDGGAPTGERAGLAASLSDCGAEDVPRVEAALFELAAAGATDTDGGGEELAQACGEGLASLWVRHERLSLELLQQLGGAAREQAVSVLCGQRPDWRGTLDALGLT
jgi:hypothetical protein